MNIPYIRPALYRERDMKKLESVRDDLNISPEKSLKISRRGFLQIVAVAGAAGALWRFGINAESGRHVVRRSLPMMGTVLNLTVIGPDRDSAEEAVDATIERMLNTAGRLSRFDPQSEVSQLNRNGFLGDPGKELLEVLTLGESISKKTAGAFDVSVLPLVSLHQQFVDTNDPPDREEIHRVAALVDYRKIQLAESGIQFLQQDMAVTLDGIGKGYVVDQGVAALKNHGFKNVFVEAGGDLMAAGSKEPGRPWRVGIRNPRPVQAQELVTVDTVNRAIATSGDYMQAYSADMRRHHIINPATGFSPPELASASVIAPSAALADGLATATMVLGADKSLALLEEWPGCEGYFVGKDMKRHQTSGFFG